MEWLANNWIWILVIGGMIGFHLFGHRGHGSGHKHGAKPPDRDHDAATGKVPSVPHSHGERVDDTADPETPPSAEPPTEPAKKSTGTAVDRLRGRRIPT